MYNWNVRPGHLMRYASRSLEYSNDRFSGKLYYPFWERISCVKESDGIVVQ